MHDLAAQHILDLEDGNKELEAHIMQREAEVQRLLSINRAIMLGDNTLPPEGFDGGGIPNF